MSAFSSSYLEIESGGKLTVSGAFPLTATISASTALTLPTTGTLSTLAGVESLSNKTVNGLTITPTASGVLTIASSKTLTCNGTLTFAAGVDGAVMTFPPTGTVLTADSTATISNKVISGSSNTISNLSASNLSTGTVPDARFPSTLPALNGSALTALNATQLTSGTVPDARFPSTLPALNGSALTNLVATNLATGTVAPARLPTVLSRVASDQTSSSTSLADVTGLTASVAANSKYRFMCLIHHQESVSTEGLGLAINGPAGITNICAEAQIYTASAGTVFLDIITAVETTVQNTTGVSASVKPAYVSGYFETGANAGTFAIRYKAETGTANSVTVKAGSFLILTQVP